MFKTIIFYIELIILIFLLIKEIIGIFKKDENKPIIKLDQYTTDFAINTLNTIIQYTTVYYIDATFGKNFSITNSISEDISNEEISEAHEIIVSNIVATLSDSMREYLIKIYGIKWLNDYISIESLSLLLNYTKYTIESLTIEKFNNK